MQTHGRARVATALHAYWSATVASVLGMGSVSSDGYLHMSPSISTGLLRKCCLPYELLTPQEQQLYLDQVDIIIKNVEG